MNRSNYFSKQERSEANKYDERISKEVQFDHDLLIRKQAWKKITKTKPPYGSYVASIKSLGDLRGKRLLELGCSTGWLSVMLHKLGANVVGVDISQASIQVAKRRAVVNKLNSHVEFHVMSTNNIEYPDSSFDLVYGLSILHHVDIKKTGNEVNRILKANGKAVFCEPVVRSNIVESFRRRIPVPYDDDQEHPALPLENKDIELIIEEFSKAKVTYYRFLTCVDRLFSNERLITAMEKLDNVVLRSPVIDILARQVVLELYK